jgi:UDP-N-acetylglucosamine:LPS N-acetylglucosamine transferase
VSEGRIVIACASNGHGHTQAALNLAAALKKQTSSSLSLINAYDHVRPMQRLILEDGFMRMSETDGLRTLYGFIHRLAIAGRLTSAMARRPFRIQARQCAEWLARRGIDHFIAMHPAAIPIGVFAKQLSGCHLSAIATDFVFHAGQYHADVDSYFVPPRRIIIGRDAAAAVRTGRVHELGIPVAAAFALQHPKPGKGFRVLVTFGGAALRALRNLPLITELISRAPRDVTFTVVAGNDEEFRNAACARIRELRAEDRVDVLGFVDQMPRLMAENHLIVGKAGGLTISEAMCAGLPTVVVDTLPGQEAYNARIVRNAGVGMRTRRVDAILQYIQALRAPRFRAEISSAALREARPDSACRIAERILAKA